MTNNLKIIQDIFLLYELSLAVGGSLNSRENCLHFLQVLVSRKGLGYAAVWLKDGQDGSFRLFTGIPGHQVKEKMLPADHFIAKKLADSSFFSLAYQDGNFPDLVQENNISKGAIALFSLGDLGFLKIFSLKKESAFSKMEMSQLEPVIRKFKISLDGSLAYERLQEESRRRQEMQKELSKSTARYVDLFENMKDAMVIFDEKGDVLEANRASLVLSGIKEGEKGKLNLWEMVHPDDVQKTKDAINTIIEEGLFTGFEARIITRQGEVKHVQVNSSGVFDENGRLVGSKNIIRDVTRQKVAEEALRNSQFRMSALIQNLQAGILLEDEQRRIVLVNQFFCDIFSIPVTPKALVGADCSESAEQSKSLFEDPESFVKGINERLKRRELVVGEELRMADGRIMERDYIPLFVDGKYLGHLWQYHDRTKQRVAAEAIRQSEEKYRGIIENMELGLLEVDNDGSILRAYERFCDMTGYQAEELIGKNANEVLVPLHQRHIIDKQNAERLKGKADVYEIQIKKKDGSPLDVLISGSPLMNSEGEVVGSLGIHYNITERKKLEKDLAKATLQAEQARLAEQQFLANMSHEIRTPMNSVIGMTHLLYNTPINDQQKEMLDSLRFSADTLMGIISNILDLSKIEAGELEMEDKVFNLLQLTQAIQRSFQFKLRDKSVSVVLDFDQRIKNMVKADPTRINQILTNLMGNASKFTNSGTVGLRVKLLAEDTQHYLLAFEVHDTGMGIPEDKIDSIFQNFKQADIKVSRRFGGTGLGLAIVKQLVDILGGKISVQSRRGYGSTFRVELKLENTGVKAMEYEPSQAPLDSRIKSFLSTLNILVVEDNPMNQRLNAQILETWGATYEMVADGKQALDLSTKNVYDLILMDLHMPGMDGYETTRLIRQEKRNPNQKTPIIALTAAALLEEKKKALESGMNDFVAKPFSPTSLRDRVLHLLGYDDLKISEDASIEEVIASPNVRIDLTYLNEFSGGDHFFVMDMINTFLQETPGALKTMIQAEQEQAWDQLYRIVHSLKANLMMLGMKVQEHDAVRIEKMIKEQPIDRIQMHAWVVQLVEDIKVAFPLLKEKLNK